MKTRIVVRTATPWETMTKEDFYSQSDPLLTPMARDEVKRPQYIDMWEEAYKRDYCLYRAMVRDAAMSCHRGVRADAITIGVDNLDLTGEDEILLPIDDDDHYSVHVVPVVKEAMKEGVNLVVWPHNQNFLGERRVKPFTRYLDTCNWAIRKSFVAQWPRDEALVLLAHHWVGSGMVADRLNPTNEGGIKSLFEMLKPHAAVGGVTPKIKPLIHPSIVELTDVLSTYYVHSGSISFLRGGKMQKHSDTVRYLRSLPLHPLLS